MSNREPILPALATVNGRIARGLGNLSFFKGVSETTIEELGRRCRWLEVHEGEALISAGAPLDKVFFVLRGEFRFLMYTPGGRVLSLRGAVKGSFIGEAALVEDVSIAYSIEAARYSTVASVSARMFFECMESDRELLRAVMRSVAERYDMLAEHVVELTTLSVPARVQNELARLCRENVNSDGSATIYPFPTQADLARRIGTHREAVSRAMSHLQSIGVVVRDGERLFIPHVGRLAIRK